MDEKQKLSNIGFIKTNGKIMRTLTILGHEYKDLDSIQELLKNDGVNETEFINSLDFLNQEGYLKMRTKNTKELTTLADCDDYDRLEVIWTGKGNRLMRGGIIDDMIEV